MLPNKQPTNRASRRHVDDFTRTKRPVVIGPLLSPCVTGKAVKIPVPRTGMILNRIPEFDAFDQGGTVGFRVPKLYDNSVVV